MWVTTDTYLGMYVLQSVLTYALSTYLRKYVTARLTEAISFSYNLT